jgi:signal transducing adaptor molecule
LVQALYSYIEAATSEANTCEDWASIIDICERADESEAVADEVVNLLSKRILSKNVNVVLFSLTLANSLLQNCGSAVKRALSSRIFVDSLLKQLANKKAHGTAKLRILELIQQWAEMYKDDDGMAYLIGTYEELKRQSMY